MALAIGGVICSRWINVFTTIVFRLCELVDTNSVMCCYTKVVSGFLSIDLFNCLGNPTYIVLYSLRKIVNEYKLLLNYIGLY